MSLGSQIATVPICLNDTSLLSILHCDKNKQKSQQINCQGDVLLRGYNNLVIGSKDNGLIRIFHHGHRLCEEVNVHHGCFPQKRCRSKGTLSYFEERTSGTRVIKQTITYSIWLRIKKKRYIFSNYPSQQKTSITAHYNHWPQVLVACLEDRWL